MPRPQPCAWWWWRGASPRRTGRGGGKDGRGEQWAWRACASERRTSHYAVHLHRKAVASGGCRFIVSGYDGAERRHARQERNRTRHPAGSRFDSFGFLRMPLLFGDTAPHDFAALRHTGLLKSGILRMPRRSHARSCRRSLRMPLPSRGGGGGAPLRGARAKGGHGWHVKRGGAPLRGARAKGGAQMAWSGWGRTRASRRDAPPPEGAHLHQNLPHPPLCGAGRGMPGPRFGVSLRLRASGRLNRRSRIYHLPPSVFRHAVGRYLGPNMRWN